MEAGKIYLEDRFLSRGLADIWDERERRVGRLDLQDIWTMGVSVLDLRGNELASGKFGPQPHTWVVTDRTGKQAGELRARFAFYYRQFEYAHLRRGTFPAVLESCGAEIAFDTAQGRRAASLAKKINGFLGPVSFELVNCSELHSAEWMAAAMGIYALERRQRSDA